MLIHRAFQIQYLVGGPEFSPSLVAHQKLMKFCGAEGLDFCQFLVNFLALWSFHSQTILFLPYTLLILLFFMVLVGRNSFYCSCGQLQKLRLSRAISEYPHPAKQTQWNVLQMCNSDSNFWEPRFKSILPIFDENLSWNQLINSVLNLIKQMCCFENSYIMIRKRFSTAFNNNFKIWSPLKILHKL